MKRLSIILLCLLIVSSLAALEIPALSGRVNDLAGLLDQATRERLEGLLAQLQERTDGIQVAVLTLPGLEGEELSDFAYRVASSWKLGKEGANNGVLLLVALAERQVRIEVGYGLEEKLTDAKSFYVINRDIVPLFKKGDFAGGIAAGVQSVVGVVAGDIDISESDLRNFDEQQRKKKKGGLPIGLIIGFWILVLILRGRGGRGGGAFWMGGMGGMGGGGSSSGGFGGFSGGGGSFGGGGASGRW